MLENTDSKITIHLSTCVDCLYHCSCRVGALNNVKPILNMIVLEQEGQLQTKFVQATLHKHWLGIRTKTIQSTDNKQQKMSQVDT